MADNELLDALIDEWEARRATGETPTPEEVCQAHPELLAQFRQLVAALLRFDDAFGSTAPGSSGAAVPPAMFGGRYAIERIHDAGGQGVVYFAQDQELQRKIVVKAPNAGLSNRATCRQFEYEALVTGQLEHPGIVPVYGFGYDRQGLPYYAMRFIDGINLSQAIQQLHESPIDWNLRSLAVRRLLQHLVAVCRTIAFAHSRQIIHRDVKPANIMLGKYGEVLLVDWGLAKRLNSPDFSATAATPNLLPETAELSRLTRDGTVKGTLKYMSPEQAAGQIADIGPASDIFSLGASLYEVLTGQTAYAGTTSAELLAHVRQGLVVPPRQIKPNVPRALEAICVKSMARRPEDRYASAELLADDLERWLADEPVRVDREPWTATAARWTRRHRSVVATTAMMTFLIMIALLTFLVALSRKNTELATAHERTEASLRRAEAEASRAQRSLQTGLDAIHDMLLEVGHDQLAYVPEMDGVRRKILQDSAKFLAAFSDFDDSPRLQRERGLARQFLAEVQVQLDQPDVAEANYRAALAIHEQLAAREPDQLEHQNDLANCRHDLARAISSRHAEEATQLLQQSLAEFSELITRGFPAQQGLAIATNTAAIHHARLGDQLRSRQLYERAAELWEAVVEQDPADAREAHRRLLAHVYHNLGQACLAEPATARKFLDRARDILASAPEDPALARRYRADLPEVLTTLAALAEVEKNSELAIETSRQALELRRELATLYPHQSHVRDNVARNHHDLGAAFHHLGRLQDAQQEYGAAIVIRRELVDRWPQDEYLRVGLAETCVNAAQVAHQLKQFVLAEELFTVAHDSLAELSRQYPATIRYQVSLSANDVNFGNFLRETDRIDESIAHHTAAIDRLETLLSAQRSDADTVPTLINSHGALTLTLVQQKRFAEAVPHCDRLVELAPQTERINWRLWRLPTYLAADRKKAAQESRDLLATGELSPIQVFAVSSVLAQATLNLSSE